MTRMIVVTMMIVFMVVVAFVTDTVFMVNVDLIGRTCLPGYHPQDQTNTDDTFLYIYATK